MRYFATVPLLILFVFISGCRKENAKHDYIYSLTFSNGEQVQMEVTIREKPKAYTDKSDKTFWKNNKDYIAIVYGNPVDGTINRIIGSSLMMIKTEDKKLITNAKSYIRLSNSSFTGVSDFEMLGSFTSSGEYKRFGRRITVEAGTFSFEWNNAEEVGKNDTILTGTWTLKRD